MFDRISEVREQIDLCLQGEQRRVEAKRLARGEEAYFN